MLLPDGTVRKKLIRWESGPPARFLTFSCYGRRQLLDTAPARDMFQDCLARAHDRFRFRLLAWVVMPEHVHLILIPPSAGMNMSRALVAIKQPVAQRLIRQWRLTHDPRFDDVRSGAGESRFWQEGGGFDRNIRDADELARETDYIHMNPVRRGLASHPRDWLWSSAHPRNTDLLRRSVPRRMHADDRSPPAT